MVRLGTGLVKHPEQHWHSITKDMCSMQVAWVAAIYRYGLKCIRRNCGQCLCQDLPCTRAMCVALAMRSSATHTCVVGK